MCMFGQEKINFYIRRNKRGWEMEGAEEKNNKIIIARVTFKKGLIILF